MKKILGFMVAVPLLGAALPAVADDWRRDDRRYDDRYRRGDAFRFGYDRGYEDGAREGSREGRRGERFDFRREGRYRDGDSGYKRHFGSRQSYVAGYRSGYAEGYRRGFYSRSRGRYGYERGRYGRHDEGGAYRHRHHGSDRWCDDRHDDWDDDDWGRVIFERPRY